MFTMLDVAIGLAFTFLLLSLLCTAITEWVSTVFGLRAKFLVRAVGRLAKPGGESPHLAAQPILDQPEIQALSIKKGHPPSYVPKAAFVRAARRALPDDKRSDQELGEQFDATMDRASGWFKRRIQLVSALVALAITLVANADTVRIADRLWRSPLLRTQFVEAARRRVAVETARRVAASITDLDNPAPDDSVVTRQSDEEEEAPSMPPPTEAEQELLGGVMGWRIDYPEFNALVAAQYAADRDRICAQAGKDDSCAMLLARIAADPRVRIDGARILPTDAWPGAHFWMASQLGPVFWRRWPGWLLTIAAISIGAPFWFDTLNRFINIRGSGKPPEDQKKKGDR